MILQRDVVDRARVERLDDRRFRARCRTTRSSRARLREAALRSGTGGRRAARRGWKARGRECWVGLVFSSPAALIHGTSVVWTLTVFSRPEIVAQLADRLDERKALDIADGAADLADDEVAILDFGDSEFLDRVGDVRDDLDGRAEIVAAPLPGDDVAIDPAGGDIVGLLGGNAGEALVMAEVEVGLRPVVGHVDLAVLIGRHRARIDVQIGVELADSDLVSARLEERSERGGEQAFSKGRHHAAGDENEPRHGAYGLVPDCPIGQAVGEIFLLLERDCRRVLVRRGLLALLRLRWLLPERRFRGRRSDLVGERRVDCAGLRFTPAIAARRLPGR